jgi:hypothetical protein
MQRLVARDGVVVAVMFVASRVRSFDWVCLVEDFQALQTRRTQNMQFCGFTDDHRVEAYGTRRATSHAGTK